MTTTAPPTTTAPLTTPAPLVRPAWVRWRFWAGLLGTLALAAALIGLLDTPPGRPLDPASSAADGSSALARVLAGYGTRLVSTDDLDARGSTVVVTAPDTFSTSQLRGLATRNDRVVLIAPDTSSTEALLPSVQPGQGDPDDSPSCTDAGARAAGPVDLPADTISYVRTDGLRLDATRCYGGALIVTPRVVIIGSAQLFENQALGDRGVAALAVNIVSADRTVSTVRWLRAGASAAGQGQVSIFSLFPAGAYRVVLWLAVVGLLACVWRGRRLGSAVAEPLPVLVRSSEIVEGHGRLYERAGARDRAAAALRAATARRLAARLGVRRDAGSLELVAAIAARQDRASGEIWTLLAGPPPGDDAELASLARALQQLENTTREDAR